MATTNLDKLTTNLDIILSEVQTKIIPENIKAGVTIFGVTGTYTGEEPNELSPEEPE